MLHLIRFWLIVSFCFNAGHIFAQHVEFRNYLHEEGFGNSTIYHVFHDSKGFTWFGTEFGVIRFDGKNYLKLTISDGLSDNEVLKIQEDSKGRIWFLTFNGRVSYYYQGKIFNEANNPILKTVGALATLNSLYEDQQGNLWFSGYNNQILKISTTNQVQKFDFGFHKKASIIGKNTIFYEDKKGNLLIASEKNFHKFNSNINIEPLSYKYKIKGLKTNYSNQKSYLLFLSAEGLVEMQDTVQRLLIPSKKLPVPHQITSFFVDKNQNIWFNTQGEGVYQIKNFKKNPEPYRHYLPGRVVTSINQDRENNLWFTTAGEGVYMLPGNYFDFKSISYTKEEGLASNNIYSVIKDNNNQLWLGLDNGKVNKISSTGIQLFNVNYSATNYNRVLDLFIDNKKTIWCATDIGTVKVVPTRKAKYKAYNMLYHQDARPYAVKSIAQSPDGKITFVHAAGIETYKAAIDPRNPYWVAPIKGVPRNRTYTHFYDHAGTLWFANINGLQQHLKPNTVINYGVKNYLLSRRITEIGELPDSSLVIATYGYGIIIFKNNQIIRHITKKDGLADDICKKIFIKDNTIWVATAAGLSKLVLNNSKITIRSYYHTDGLVSNGINDVYADEQQVYVATAKGLSILPNSNERLVSNPPPVYLTQVTVGKKNITHLADTKFNYQQNRFIFNFIGITYQDPANTKYLYRLHGVNSNWTATTNNSVEFSTLSPGSYIFEVKARKQNSTWSQPVHFSFTINPPVWRTWWFLTIFSVLALGIVFIISWVFLQQKLKIKIKRLETDHKIQLERERIARDLHDNVGSHLTYIVNRLDDSPYLLQEPEQQNQMEQLREYTRQTIIQLRETIWAIRKEHISVGELNDKLQKLLWQLVPPQGPLTYQFKSQANEAILLTPVQTLNIFRIAQEAITNVLKHSRANFLTVQLTTVADKYLQLLLQDNGVGFEPAQVDVNENYGLTNMHERAAELKTSLKITSDVGKGTQITLLVNLIDVMTPDAESTNTNHLVYKNSSA